MMRRIVAIVTLISIILQACEKDEIAIPAHDPGNVMTSQLEMGSSYNDQLFYALESNTVISVNQKTDWDLGFETSEQGWHIILNNSTGAAAANMHVADFESVAVLKELEWRWDAHSGNPDSTAIGDWREKTELYVIDRGYDVLGNHRGYRKIMFLDYDQEKYVIQLASMDGLDIQQFEIQKDSIFNYISFSFDKKSVVSIQPPGKSWDLLFTQYTHIFLEPEETPYLVTGVLINRERIAVATDVENSFENISYEDVQGYHFQNEANIIGYDWKFYDYEEDTYIIDPGINYVIRTFEGVYYKLHFIDFYNDAGEKGASKFELQRL